MAPVFKIIPTSKQTPPFFTLFSAATNRSNQPRTFYFTAKVTLYYCSHTWWARESSAPKSLSNNIVEAPSQTNIILLRSMQYSHSSTLALEYCILLQLALNSKFFSWAIRIPSPAPHPRLRLLLAAWCNVLYTYSVLIIPPTPRSRVGVKVWSTYWSESVAQFVQLIRLKVLLKVLLCIRSDTFFRTDWGHQPNRSDIEPKLSRLLPISLSFIKALSVTFKCFFALRLDHK